MKNCIYLAVFTLIISYSTNIAIAESVDASLVCLKNGLTNTYSPARISFTKAKKMKVKKIATALSRQKCRNYAQESLSESFSLFNCVIPINKTVNIVQGRGTTISFPNTVIPLGWRIGNYTVTRRPSHGAITPSVPSSYRISAYAPESSYHGVDKYGLIADVTYGLGRLFNCKVHAKAIINIAPGSTPTPTVTPTPRRPIPVSSEFTILENTAANLTLQVTNRTSSTQCSVTSQPSNGTLTEISGQPCKLRYTPRTGYSGVDRFRFTAVDGSYRSPVTAEILLKIDRVDFAGFRESFDHYRNQLTQKEVKHLLRKIAYCGSPELVEFGRTHSLDELVDVLLNGFGNIQPVLAKAEQLREDAKVQTSLNIRDPINNAPVRYKTIDKVLYTLHSNQVYTWHLLRNSTIPLKERMTLWLYNQMPVNITSEIGALGTNWLMKQYVDGIRQESLGSYQKYLTMQNSLGAMGYFLDNFDNSVRIGNPAPQNPLGGQLNVNFGREFLELGALGKYDPITGIPSYTELDVKSMALAARGFRATNGEAQTIQIALESDPTQVIPYTYSPRALEFDPTRWMLDPSNPTPIKFFAGTPYEKTDIFKMDSFSTNGDTVTPYILYNNPAAARFIAARLYTSLINPEPTEAIVSKLAQELIAVRFELKPFLKKLLTSSMMFHSGAVRSAVASPVQVLACTLRTFNLPLESTDNSVLLYNSIINASRNAGQNIWAYPSIFGINEGGKNGDGVINKGEEFLTPQQLLARQQGMVFYLNNLDAMRLRGQVDFTWNQLLPRDSRGALITTPEGILSAYLDKLDITLSPEERARILNYLTTVSTKIGNEEAGTATLIWDPSAANYNDVLRIKLPGLIVLLSQLIQTNLM